MKQLIANLYSDRALLKTPKCRRYHGWLSITLFNFVSSTLGLFVVPKSILVGYTSSLNVIEFLA
ncbi:hypothetical protein RO3G_06944 [Rhizopus delemar RA 99-880]|uniref:Uncharacterized protein n=1 Tax=Rhizopus delemar (strain RA 99-880 / ATCC MYA-4621 / FGSC 9543 / NRRL 43880) TaxID=246409 RepID=I1C1A9_RHIO9|nr:hypothetical protein RO3G_06944 [Rhizopus delemar RA 99-880]|eukprot:EIE82239.1 hypothetical protein RO3G_06944 [Rhizopus delemar RA 99-880]